MPFTASHIAIILPLLKKRIFSASGLLMGSMVPDFEFFLRMEAHGPYGHSLFGMFWLNMPIALGFITLYHNVVRDPLIEHLPPYFKKRFLAYVDFDWNTFFKTHFWTIFFSVIVGNLSHLFWDAFTHFDGFFVLRMPFLKASLFNFYVYDILQYVCSVIGAIVILMFLHRLPSEDMKTEKTRKQKLEYWFLVMFCIVLVYGIRFNDVPDFRFGERIVCFLSGLLLGLLVASVYMRFIQQIKHKKAPTK